MIIDLVEIENKNKKLDEINGVLRDLEKTFANLNTRKVDLRNSGHESITIQQNRNELLCSEAKLISFISYSSRSQKCKQKSLTNHLN